MVEERRCELKRSRGWLFIARRHEQISTAASMRWPELQCSKAMTWQVLIIGERHGEVEKVSWRFGRARVCLDTAAAMRQQWLYSGARCGAARKQTEGRDQRRGRVDGGKEVGMHGQATAVGAGRLTGCTVQSTVSARPLRGHHRHHVSKTSMGPQA